MKKLVMFLRALWEAWGDLQEEKQERERKWVETELEIEQQQKVLADDTVRAIEANTKYYKARTQLVLAKKRG